MALQARHALALSSPGRRHASLRLSPPNTRAGSHWQVAQGRRPLPCNRRPCRGGRSGELAPFTSKSESNDSIFQTRTRRRPAAASSTSVDQSFPHIAGVGCRSNATAGRQRATPTLPAGGPPPTLRERYHPPGEAPTSASFAGRRPGVRLRVRTLLASRPPAANLSPDIRSPCAAPNHPLPAIDRRSTATRRPDTAPAAVAPSPAATAGTPHRTPGQGRASASARRRCSRFRTLDTEHGAFRTPRIAYPRERHDPPAPQTGRLPGQRESDPTRACHASRGPSRRRDLPSERRRLRGLSAG